MIEFSRFLKIFYLNSINFPKFNLKFVRSKTNFAACFISQYFGVLGGPRLKFWLGFRERNFYTTVIFEKLIAIQDKKGGSECLKKPHSVVL